MTEKERIRKGRQTFNLFRKTVGKEKKGKRKERKAIANKTKRVSRKKTKEEAFTNPT